MKDADKKMIITYILKVKQKNNEINYYCGKTSNMNRRLKEHKRRKDVIGFIHFEGDYEKQIKRAGVKFIFVLYYKSRDNEVEVSAS